MRPYYQDSAVTIYHGDCREWAGTWEVLVTDPPYGLNLATLLWPSRRGHLEPAAWDSEAADLAGLVDHRPACIWGGNYFPLPLSRGWMVWLKPDAAPSMGDAELAWTNLDQNVRAIIHSIAATNGERVAHPTQKPIVVMKWCLAGMPEGLVFDPFAGSGTTLRAAKDLGRKAIGIEIEERYCEIAARRCAQEVIDFAEVRGGAPAEPSSAPMKPRPDLGTADVEAKS